MVYKVAYVFAQHVCSWYPWRTEKKAMDVMQLELPMVACCTVGAGNRTHTLGKYRKWFLSSVICSLMFAIGYLLNSTSFLAFIHILTRVGGKMVNLCVCSCAGPHGWSTCSFGGQQPASGTVQRASTFCFDEFLLTWSYWDSLSHLSTFPVLGLGLHATTFSFFL